MDLPNLPSRVELAALPNAMQARVPVEAMTTKAETARPVLGPAVARLPMPIKGLGIAPLDVFQVGDNDEIPLPPDPPRRSVGLTVLHARPQSPMATAVEEAVAASGTVSASRTVLGVAPATATAPAPDAGAGAGATADAAAKSASQNEPPIASRTGSDDGPQGEAQAMALKGPAQILPQLMQALEQGPANPTLDIRR